MIYYIYVFHVKFDMMVHLELCDLDLTLKRLSTVKMSRGKLIVHRLLPIYVYDGHNTLSL